MRCDEFKQLVPDLTYGELDEARSAQAAAHAASCKECARLLATARGGLTALSALEAVPAPSCLEEISLAIRRRPLMARLPWESPAFSRAFATAMALILAAAVLSVVSIPRGLGARSGQEAEYAARLARLETLSEELNAELERNRKRRLVIGVTAPNSACAILSAAGYSPERLPDGTISLSDAAAIDAPQQIAILLVQAGAPPSRLYVDEEALEDYFLRLVGLDEG